MFTRFPSLTLKEVKELNTLAESVEMIPSASHRRRIGDNGKNNLSNYQYSRYFNWTHEQREQFKTFFPEAVSSKALVGWFLDIPAEVGLLDRMSTWVGKKMAGTSIAFALANDQTIYINDQKVVVPKGEGIGFKLSEVHEIRKGGPEQRWACVMVLGDPVTFL